MNRLHQSKLLGVVILGPDEKVRLVLRRMILVLDLEPVQKLLVVLDPLAWRQLSHVNTGPLTLERPGQSPCVFARLFRCARKPLEVWFHGLHRLATECVLDVLCHNLGVVRRYVRRKASPNTLCTIHEYHRHDGQVVRRLDILTILRNILEHWIVTLVENTTRLFSQTREDVTRTGGIFATHQARSKLTARLEQVDVVRTDKRLCQSDDCALERRLAVVVRRVFCYVPTQLCHLGILDQVPLQTCVNNFALTRFESVCDMWNRALNVLDRKVCQVLVDEISHSQLLDISVIDTRWSRRHVIHEPSLSCIRHGFGKGERHRLAGERIRCELHSQTINHLEVLLSLC